MTATAVHPDTDWILRPKPNPGAAVRLFCFPWAGGGASVYRRWAEALPGTIEVCAVQLPGRESRFREIAYQTMEGLIPDLCDGIWPYLTRPYAFFGHSMGATVAFELARQIRRKGLPGPRRLLVSGARAPQLPEGRPPLHLLPQPQFWQAVCRLNGMAPEVTANDELCQLLTPMLRADFSVCETYRFHPEAPLDSPITALGGDQDRLVTVDRLVQWGEQTTGEFRLHLFSGDHFFVNTAWQEVLRVVARELG
ncbi:MAG: thioesterase II family protein [Mycobacterium leprae]